MTYFRSQNIYFFCSVCFSDAVHSVLLHTFTLKFLNDPFPETWGSLGGDGQRSRGRSWNGGRKVVTSPQLLCPFLCQSVRDGDTSNLSFPWWKEALRLVLQLQQAKQPVCQPSRLPDSPPVSHFVDLLAIIQQPVTSHHDCSVWPVFRSSLIHGKFQRRVLLLWAGVDWWDTSSIFQMWMLKKV